MIIEWITNVMRNLFFFIGIRTPLLECGHFMDWIGWKHVVSSLNAKVF